MQVLDLALADLHAYGKETLSDLSSRTLITFHDGFSYFARAFDLEIAAAIEEEPGSETSAGVLKDLILLAQRLQVRALFVEEYGSTASASVISRETRIPCYRLSMGISGSYMDAMYQNIFVIKEALK